MSDVTSYDNGGYIPSDGTIRVWVMPGETIISAKDVADFGKARLAALNEAGDEADD